MSNNNNNNTLFNLTRTALLAASLLAAAGTAAGATVSADMAKAPAFLGGIQVERDTTTVSAHLAQVYAAYDAEAIGRYFQPGQEVTGIDPVQTAAIIPGVFRSVAIPMKNFPVSARWAPIYRAVSGCLGGACSRMSADFAETVAAARQEGFLGKLDRVNRGINTLIAYRRDKVVYGSIDHWATPAEILKRGAGDCEDFAILKMAALVDAGVPAQSMSLVVLQDSQKGVFHAVLSVTTGSGTFILDNVRGAVVKDTSLPSYVPLYSFSTDRAWIHGSKAGGTQLAATKGGFASIAPGEGTQETRPARKKRAGWMPAVSG